MKKLLLLALVSTYAMSGFNTGTAMKSFNTQKEDMRLCKVFIKKAHDYKESMDKSTLAMETLNSYKDRVVSYCSTDVASAKMRNIIALGDNKVLCKIAIREAHEHQDTMNNSKYDKDTLTKRKEKVVTYCGSLVAKS